MEKVDHYEQFLVYRSKHWSVYVHEQQYYLGRVIVQANRGGFVDIFTATMRELYDLVLVVWKITGALKRLFVPDLFNYSNLGTHADHCQLDIIPRYSTARTFQGETFYDGYWGRHPRNMVRPELTAKELHELRDAIKESL